jgi:hypothetical protein
MMPAARHRRGGAPREHDAAKGNPAFRKQRAISIIYSMPMLSRERGML